MFVGMFVRGVGAGQEGGGGEREKGEEMEWARSIRSSRCNIDHRF